MTIHTERIAPTGTERRPYFWDKFGPEGEEESKHEGGLAVGDFPTYPPLCPEAVKVREVRRARAIYLGVAARALGLTVVEFGELERGCRRVVAPSTWDDVLQVLVGLAAEPG